MLTQYWEFGNMWYFTIIILTALVGIALYHFLKQKEKEEIYKVLYKLSNKIKDYEYIIVDQFAESYVYFNYLKDSPNVVKNITFFTKGEDKHLSVACASLISRYIFIKEFDKLSNSVDIELPKGASNLVYEAGKKIINKYGFDKLKDIAKMNFKNTEKIKEIDWFPFLNWNFNRTSRCGFLIQ